MRRDERRGEATGIIKEPQIKTKTRLQGRVCRRFIEKAGERGGGARAVATHEGLKKVADAEAVNHDGQERQQREQPRGLLQAPHGIAPLRQLTQEARERAGK